MLMRHRRSVPLILLATASLLAAGAPMAVAGTDAARTARGTTISTRTTNIGKVVVGASKRTVYLFAHDKTTKSTCGASCRIDWPPVMTHGKPVAGAGIKKAHLGQNAKHQVTYYGHPLYYFIGDNKKAGRTTGNGLNEFGGRWWVLSPTGKAGKGLALRMHSTKDGSAVAGPLNSGRTLYALSSESKSSLKCKGSNGCTGEWPPLIVTGKARAGSGTTAHLIGTVVRSDGTRQVTYNGHPLYYFAGDSAAGQDNGKCVADFGGTWHFLNSAGTAVTAPCSPGGGGSGTACSPRPNDGVVGTATKTGVGEVIVDSLGCTLYEYTGDTSTTSNCNSSCATSWPPLMISSGSPTATGDAQANLLGTISAHGGTQVTYNGHPLYYYTSDANSDQATGEGLGVYSPPNYYYFYVLGKDGNQA